MSDAVRRAIRGAVQAFVAAAFGSIMLSFNGATGVVDWSVIKKVLIAAAFAGITGVVTYAHNWAEDNTTFPAILKSQPSTGQNPVTQDPAK